MPVSKLDENSRPTIICANKNNGTAIVPIMADPVTHCLKVDSSLGGVDNGNNNGNAMLDENSIPVWTALSSAGDGSIVEVYGDNGNILIDY